MKEESDYRLVVGQACNPSTKTGRRGRDPGFEASVDCS